jgi:hypothetical protein
LRLTRLCWRGKAAFFGGQTKGDIRKTNEVLLEIIDLDNKIMRSLNRVVDFRNFEKVTMNYDLRDRDERLEALVRAVDTLSQRSDRLVNQNRELNRKLSGRTILAYFLGLLALLLFAWSRRKP